MRRGRGWISSSHGRNKTGKTRLKALFMQNNTRYVSKLIIVCIIYNLLSFPHFPTALYTQNKVPQRVGEEVLGLEVLGFN